MGELIISSSIVLFRWGKREKECKSNSEIDSSIQIDNRCVKICIKISLKSVEVFIFGKHSSFEIYLEEPSSVELQVFSIFLVKE